MQQLHIDAYVSDTPEVAIKSENSRWVIFKDSNESNKSNF